MNRTLGHTLLGIAMGALAALVLGRHTVGRGLVGPRHHGSLALVAIGAAGGALVAYLASRGQSKLSFVALLITGLVLAFALMSLQVGDALG